MLLSNPSLIVMFLYCLYTIHLGLLYHFYIVYPDFSTDWYYLYLKKICLLSIIQKIIIMRVIIKIVND